jgi:hypothetical protein
MIGLQDPTGRRPRLAASSVRKTRASAGGLSRPPPGEVRPPRRQWSAPPLGAAAACGARTGAAAADILHLPHDRRHLLIDRLPLESPAPPHAVGTLARLLAATRAGRAVAAPVEEPGPGGAAGHAERLARHVELGLRPLLRSWLAHADGCEPTRRAAVHAGRLAFLRALLLVFVLRLVVRFRLGFFDWLPAAVSLSAAPWATWVVPQARITPATKRVAKRLGMT